MIRALATLLFKSRTMLVVSICTVGALLFGASGAVHAQVSPAPATPAAVDTGGWPIRIQGMPADFHRGAEGGYYLWHDGNGLHLWVTDPENIDSHYTGTITTSGSFTNVQMEHPEQGDSYQQQGDGMISFNLHTHSGIDGMDFEIAGGAGTTLSFDLYRDGHKVATSHIFEGVAEVNPAHNPVDFVRR